ncbi:hypothetical protein [Planococcus plakortidis]|uniref:hypothetical protein n=1 Tax=Planococcus plakortidis TaxID=1038856 RepID=UPI00385C7C0C
MFKSYVKLVEKYGFLFIACFALVYLFTSWGENWALTWLHIGALITAPIIGVSDMKGSQTGRDQDEE